MKIKISLGVKVGWFDTILCWSDYSLFTPEISFVNLMSVSAIGSASLWILLEPRMHNTREFISEKLIFVRT